MSSIWRLLTSLWDVFARASPFAVAVTVGVPIFALVGGVRWWVHKRFRRAKAPVLRLEEPESEPPTNNSALQALQSRLELENAVLQRERFPIRLPETARTSVETELRDNDYERANAVAVSWLEAEGKTISRLALHRANWAAAHAAGDLLLQGLVAAEAYATAAVALYPENQKAVDLRDDVERYRDRDQPSPPLTKALADFDQRVLEQLNQDPTEAANAAEDEAARRYERGHYHLALPLVERAVTLRLKTAGPNAVQTFGTSRLKACILIALGHSEEALPIARAVAAAQEASPALGPAHPKTLGSRYLVAHILETLGHSEEALPIVRAVAEAQQASPALGPTHPSTLASRYLLAQILEARGYSEEALPITRAVAEAQEASPALGPTHPSTLASRYLVARILETLGRGEEALPIARAVAEAEEANAALGPSHSSTLASRHLVAQILETLGRSEEALPIARAVAEAEEASAALGPTHPSTVASRYLVAQILETLGRSEEARPIARTVAGAADPKPIPPPAVTLVQKAEGGSAATAPDTPVPAGGSSLHMDGLSDADSVIFEHACKAAVAQGHSVVISGEGLVRDLKREGISHQQIMETERILEGLGYIKIHRVVGLQRACDFAITKYGFDQFARKGIPDYGKLCADIARRIVRDGRTSSNAVAQELYQPIKVVEHVFESLENSHLIKCSESMMGGLHLDVYWVSPELERKLEEDDCAVQPFAFTAAPARAR